jgi:hypothetical protein
VTQQRVDGWGHSLPTPVPTRAPADRLVKNTADTNGGGQDGYTISVQNIAGSYAGLTVNNNETVTYGNTLYSPTMRPGDPSCLEGTNVINSATSQNFVGFYTFCGSSSLQNDGNNGFYGQLYYTDPNFSHYTVTFNGQTIVTMEVVDRADGWHGLLYNYYTHQYEDRLAVNGSCDPNNGYARRDAPGGCNLRGGTPNGGWVMHETHYPNGLTCSSVSEKQVQSLQTEVGTTWTLPTTDPSSFTFHDYTNGAYGGGFYSYGACSAYSQYGPTSPWYKFTPSTNPGSGYLWDIVTD